MDEATTAYIQYNQSGKNKALANKNIREAFNLATDRQQYVDTVTPASNPATGLTPAGMAKTNTGEDFAKYAAQPYKYDATAAKAAWAKGLSEIGETKLTLTLKDIFIIFICFEKVWVTNTCLDNLTLFIKVK